MTQVQVTLCLADPAPVIEHQTGFCPVRYWAGGLNTDQAEWRGQEMPGPLPPPRGYSHQGCYQRETE